MNTENNTQKFVCECGKSFDKIRQMTGHQSNCNVHKQKLIQEKEARRLPNGMFKCENPDCQKEHDGHYGSGRFCCKKCKSHYNSLMAAKTQIKNGTKYSFFLKKIMVVQVKQLLLYMAHGNVKNVI